MCEANPGLAASWILDFGFWEWVIEFTHRCFFWNITNSNCSIPSVPPIRGSQSGLLTTESGTDLHGWSREVKGGRSEFMLTDYPEFGSGWNDKNSRRSIQNPQSKIQNRQAAPARESRLHFFLEFGWNSGRYERIPRKKWAERPVCWHSAPSDTSVVLINEVLRDSPRAIWFCGMGLNALFSTGHFLLS